MNRLAKETSPYLLQHAHNPVDWYAWKPEALERAKKEDKPILVSIGYSTCHWCHVMERESFENEEVAAFMNEHFINIKVDREERPDVDHIYMEAAQAISGSGGWPLNCFLLPDGRPFYAGTYFPPRPAHNRPSWIQVLQNMYRAFHTQRDTVEKQADRLIGYIQKADGHLLGNPFENQEPNTFLSPVLIDNIFFQLEKNFDKEEGGFGAAPKFPGSMSIRFLLNYYAVRTNNVALEQATLSLDKMIQGGIYDQIGGGFARYSTDSRWLVPHFEKMLYDNALLVSTLSDAYQLTKKDLYKDAIIETLDFVAREMTNSEGAFYAALDADSEGIEGKFYVWSKEEIVEILGEEGKLFCAFYDVTEEGNWEAVNILNRPISFEDFCKKREIDDVKAFKKSIKNQGKQLLEHRAKRIRPGLDDKILLSWNALMCTAYVHAYQATQKDDYKKIALKNLDFLLSNFLKDDGRGLYHTYKNGERQYEGFLEDYAYLIETLLATYSMIFDRSFLEKAKALCDYVIEQFTDASNGLFYFTGTNQDDIILRKKEIYDSAMPSGNSTMLRNLQQLALLTDNDNYRQRAQQMMEQIYTTTERYPSSFSKWASELLGQIYGHKEIVIVGEDAFSVAEKINRLYIPNKIVVASKKASNESPLLRGRFVENQTLIYLCSNYTCQKPVETIEEFVKLLNWNTFVEA